MIIRRIKVSFTAMALFSNTVSRMIRITNALSYLMAYFTMNRVFPIIFLTVIFSSIKSLRSC